MRRGVQSVGPTVARNRTMWSPTGPVLAPVEWTSSERRIRCPAWPRLVGAATGMSGTVVNLRMGSLDDTRQDHEGFAHRSEGDRPDAHSFHLLRSGRWRHPTTGHLAGPRTGWRRWGSACRVPLGHPRSDVHHPSIPLGRLATHGSCLL